MVQSNLSSPDSCYPGTSLNRAADSLYFFADITEIVGSTVGVAYCILRHRQI